MRGLDTSLSAPLLVALDAEALAQRPGYEVLRPGVEILYLYREAEGGAASAVLKYAPGAEVPLHEHTGYEHVLVLAGEQCDGRGRYSAGSMVINPPGYRHRVWSEGGCVVLVIWEHPVVFVEADV
jgi:anti-sigma factor ChrR (cupin superfamily)